jgi:hypothetical protein
MENGIIAKIYVQFFGFGIPGLAKNADETRVRRINNAKNGFHQL